MLRPTRILRPDGAIHTIDGVSCECVGVTDPAATDDAPRTFWQKVRLTGRLPRRGRGFWFGLAIDVLWPVVMLFSRPRWYGGRRIPRRGGVLLASNHLSFADPVTMTAYVLSHGRIPRYLAKASLWRLPIFGSVMKGGRHIPVDRDAATAAGAYAAAVRSVRDGECVLFYPEATFTDDPDGWPMRGKTGLARVALATGAPVIPIAHWGSQHLLPRRVPIPRLLPRKVIQISAGAPVDLSDLTGAEPTREHLEIATTRIMASITTQLATIRGEVPPA